jgi:hypothetical protein
MIRKLFSVGCALAALSTASSAFAGEPVGPIYQGTNKIDYNFSGNDNFWAGFSLFGSENITNSPGATTTRSLDSMQQVVASVQVLGSYQVPLVVNATAASDHVVPSAGAPTFTRSGRVVVKLMGNVVHDVTGTVNCGTQWRGCDSYDTSWDKTFFQAQDEFAVGPIPVTVTAKVRGNAHAGASAYAVSAPYFGIVTSLTGQTQARLTSGAYVSASLDAFAGVPYVLGVGVDLTFKLIDVQVTPSSSTNVALTQAGASTIIYKNQLPISLSTMSGSVTAYAQVSPFWKPTTTLISWKGFNKTYYAYDINETLTY